MGNCHNSCNCGPDVVEDRTLNAVLHQLLQIAEAVSIALCIGKQSVKYLVVKYMSLNNLIKIIWSNLLSLDFNLYFNIFSSLFSLLFIPSNFVKVAQN